MMAPTRSIDKVTCEQQDCTATLVVFSATKKKGTGEQALMFIWSKLGGVKPSRQTGAVQTMQVRQ